MALSSTPTLSHPLLNVFLVFIESIFSFILRFDGRLRQIVYPLVKAETLVCIRTYLPHTEVYATFSYKGVLLDDKNPSQKAPDVTINAYSHQLINALFTHNLNAIDSLQMRGSAEQVALVKDFLSHVGVGRVIDNLFGKFKKPSTDPIVKAQEKEDKLAKLSQALDEKTKECETLQSDIRRLNTQVAELKSKQKTLKIAFIVSVIIAIISLSLYFFR